MRDGLAIEAAVLAAVRRAAIVRCEMRRGVRGLAAVSSTAPLLGILDTCFGFLGSFAGGISGEKSTMRWALIERLSEAWIPFAFGLAVAIAAWLIGRYLRSCVDEFEHEMRIVLKDLLTAVMMARA